MNPLLAELDLSFSTPTLFDSLLPFADKYYWEYGQPVTAKEACKEFNITRAELCIHEEKLNKALNARGIPPVEFSPRVLVKKEIDPQFILACNLICDTADGRSTSAKLKSMGLTTREWQGFLRNDKMFAYYQGRVKDNAKTIVEAGKLSLGKLVEQGDLGAIKYHNEVSGVYRPNQEILLNLGVIIGRLMEVLAESIKDQDLLMEIAEKFDNVIDISQSAVRELTP